MAFVADTGPILSFARANRFDLLRDVVKTLIIPDAVYDEIVGDDLDRPGVTEIQRAKWIQRHSVQNRLTVAHFPKKLHAGEREAIALAEELSATLLVDDYEARRIAHNRGLTCIGSLRILQEAKTRGLIPVVKPVLDELKTAGLYVSNTLYQDFLLKQDEGEE